MTHENVKKTDAPPVASKVTTPEPATKTAVTNTESAEKTPKTISKTKNKVKLTEGVAHRNLGKKGGKRVPVHIKQSHLDYEEELKLMQLELMKLQLTAKEKGMRIAIIFEGRDASGKGGTIKRITQNLNARGIRVVALDKPNDQEKTQWYFQRYVQHLPSAGEIVLFDRSWYNRSMVEPVMGFCTDEQHKRFLKAVPMFEELLVKDGIHLFKFYFSVSKTEQDRRFESRKTDPLKQFKLSPVDKLAQEYWHAYSIAKFQMLNETNRSQTPWTIIRSDNKKKARINCIKHLLTELDYDDKAAKKNLKPDPKYVVSGIDEIKHMEENLMNPEKLHG
ncbi:MAG: Polyphosphate kinase 2 [uncultured Thiotrichaceae bacterium]|uniref:ADP/GDP-polyphosphate phosphotransferase n=1 Tax=uncultured Thiotrichaceae bacterium TaxID=298394 RepID=A0A6S6TVS2_9GAMM|nr:MAG: Polyphosphate kinase 2 [uncultured Thiotrichaceae bacterium]